MKSFHVESEFFLPDDFDLDGPTARKKIRFKPKLKLKEEKTESDPNVLGFEDDESDDDTSSDDDDDDDDDDEESSDETNKESIPDEVEKAAADSNPKKETEKTEPEAKIPEKKLPAADPVDSTPARFVPVHR